MDEADDIFDVLLGRSTPAEDYAEHGDPLDQDGPAPEPAPRSRGRSILIGVAVGLGVGLCAVAIAFSIIAIPMYTLASFEPGQGLQRDTVRTGLLVVALPFGLLVGLGTGIAVGIWKARGGHLPRDRTPIHN